MLIANILYTMAFVVMLHGRNNRKQQTLVKKYKHYEQLLNGIQEKNRSLQRENERLTNEIKTLEKQFRKAAPENEEKPEKNLNSIYSVRTQKLLSRHLYRDIACFAYIGSHTYFQTKKGKDKIPANEASLKKVEDTTDGFFRKVTRDLAIPQNRIVSCKRIKDGMLELQLKESLNCKVKVSKESVSNLRDWLLEAVGEIKKEERDNV